MDVDAGASTDPDGTIAGYAWNFGDGSTGTGSTASHTYAATGTYPVTLTVTDNGAKTASVTTSIAVAANPAYAQDDFGRTVSNAWGTADIGGTWSVGGTASRYSVGGGTAKVNLLTAGSSSTATLAGVSNTSTEVALVASTDKTPTGGPQYVSVIGRQVSANNDYRAKVRMDPGGVVTLYLARTVGGTETVLTTTAISGLTYSAGDKLRIRLQVTDTSPATTLRAKVWKAGTPEPAWQSSTTDSTASLQTAGIVGIYSYLSGSTSNATVAFSYDELWVGPVRP